jgi:hypothetical protein
MTQTVEALFDQAIERYKAGEGPNELIPTFKEICDRAPKSSAAWASLAWLYLLEDKSQCGLQGGAKGGQNYPPRPSGAGEPGPGLLRSWQKPACVTTSKSPYR